MKRSLIAFLLLFALLLGGTTALAAAGDSSDPLISLSYLTSWAESFFSQAKAKISAAFGTVYSAAAARVPTTAESGFAQETLQSGDRLSLTFGDSVILLSGAGKLTVENGAVINISTGTELKSGVSLAVGQRYLVAEESTATAVLSADSVVLLEGEPEISREGTAVSVSFSDVPKTHWAYSYITQLAEAQVVGGVGNGLFSPDAKMSRADFVTVLGRMSGVEKSSYPGSSFTDVAVGSYYAPYVSWAAENGIVSGYGDGCFGPGDFITRDQMAVIIVRYASYAGISLQSSGSSASFADDAAIRSWAKDAVSIAQRAGLLSGKGNNLFDPLGNTTRAEVCAVLCRLKSR